MELTGGLGADVAIEAVGVPDTFELCTELVRPGGRVANVGVHGHSVDAAPRDALDPRRDDHDRPRRRVHDTRSCSRLVASGRLDPTPFATHRFPLGETMAAYDTFADAATTHALKVVLEATSVTHGRLGARGAGHPRVAASDLRRGTRQGPRMLTRGPLLRIEAPVRDAAEFRRAFEAAAVWQVGATDRPTEAFALSPASHLFCHLLPRWNGRRE